MKAFFNMATLPNLLKLYQLMGLNPIKVFVMGKASNHNHCCTITTYTCVVLWFCYDIIAFGTNIALQYSCELDARVNSLGLVILT